MLELSSRDFEVIDSLIQFGVFKDIEGYRLDRSKGIILVCCADGDLFHDLYNHECRINLTQRGDNPRIHPLSRNGGILAYQKGNRINRYPDSYLEYMYEIGDSALMKEMPTIVIEGHGPCGAARLKNIILMAQLKTQMEMKAIIRERYSGTDVASHFHVDYKGRNGKDRKTYHFGSAGWAEWYRTQAPKFLAAA